MRCTILFFVGVEGSAWISILCSFTPCKTWTRSMPSFRGLGESSTVQAGLMGIMRRPSTLLLVGVRPSDGTCNSVGTEPMPGLSTSPQCTIQLCLSRFLLACLSTALMWGWLRFAGTLALTWGGVMGIGEALKSSPRRLAFASRLWK